MDRNVCRTKQNILEREIEHIIFVSFKCMVRFNVFLHHTFRDKSTNVSDKTTPLCFLFTY